jgi:hypothetical protein
MSATDIWEMLPEAAERKEFRARAALLDMLAEAIVTGDEKEIGERLGLAPILVGQLASREMWEFTSAQLAVYAWRLGLNPQAPVDKLKAAVAEYVARDIGEFSVKYESLNRVHITAELAPGRLTAGYLR